MNALQQLLVHAPLTALIFLIGAMFGVGLPLYRMMRGSTDFRARVEGATETASGANAALSIKSPHRESIVIRLDTNAVQKARDLIRAGANLDSVCREIDPDYASWQTGRQAVFQRAIEMMLKAAPTAKDAPQITSTKLS
jgi:hypothetical protein